MKSWSGLKKVAVISVIGIFGLAGLSAAFGSEENDHVNPPPNPTPTPVQGIETETEPQAEPVPEPTPPPPPPEPPLPPPKKSSSCDPNYTGCVPIASDVDCAGGSGNGPAYVAGPVTVIGTDVYGLDRDGDGIGCE